MKRTYVVEKRTVAQVTVEADSLSECTRLARQKVCELPESAWRPDRNDMARNIDEWTERTR